MIALLWQATKRTMPKCRFRTENSKTPSGYTTIPQVLLTRFENGKKILTLEILPQLTMSKKKIVTRPNTINFASGHWHFQHLNRFLSPVITAPSLDQNPKYRPNIYIGSEMKVHLTNHQVFRTIAVFSSVWWEVELDPRTWSSLANPDDRTPLPEAENCQRIKLYDIIFTS